jgi:hypothetical protein
MNSRVSKQAGVGELGTRRSWLLCSLLVMGCSDRGAGEPNTDASTTAASPLDGSVRDSNDTTARTTDPLSTFSIQPRSTHAGNTSSEYVDASYVSTDSLSSDLEDADARPVSTQAHSNEPLDADAVHSSDLTHSNEPLDADAVHSSDLTRSNEPLDGGGSHADSTTGRALACESTDAGGGPAASTDVTSSATVQSSFSADAGDGGIPSNRDACEGAPDRDADASETEPTDITSAEVSTHDVSTSTETTDAPNDGDAGSGYYCSACSITFANRGCTEHAYELEYEGGVPRSHSERFEALQAFSCNEPPPSPCSTGGRWRVSFPNWQGCQSPLSYPQENGAAVPLTSFDISFPTEEPTGETRELEWKRGSEPCTMQGRMRGSWENLSESGGFTFEIVLRSNGNFACGTMHYVESGFGARELVTAAVAERIP